MIKLFVIKTDEINADILLDKMSLLSSEEKNKVLKYRHGEDRVRSLAARLMLFKYALCFKDETYKDIYFVKSSEEFSKENINIFDIEYADSGKGYIKGYENIFYNISHSGVYSVCALSDREIGVDIQEIRDINENVARRFFSEKDNEFINSDLSDKKDRFIKVWTVKESFAKLTGRGIAQGLETFYEDFENNKILSVADNAKIGEFKEFAVDKGYYCFASFFI